MAIKGKGEVRNPTVVCAAPAIKDTPYPIPNSETIEAIKQVEAGEELIEHESMDEFMNYYERYKCDKLLGLRNQPDIR